LNNSLSNLFFNVLQVLIKQASLQEKEEILLSFNQARAAVVQVSKPV